MTMKTDRENLMANLAKRMRRALVMRSRIQNPLQHLRTTSARVSSSSSKATRRVGGRSLILARHASFYALRCSFLT